MSKSLSRRDMLKSLAMAAGGTILAACAPQATAAPAAAATQPPAAANPTANPAPAGATKLTMWTYTGDELFLADMFKLYQESNPNTTMEIVKLDGADQDQKITTALVAGSGLPDVADIEQGRFRKFVYSPGILDLTPYKTAAHKDEMPKWCWEAGLSPDQSQILFLYYSVGVAVIHYRRSLFKAAGLPSDPESVQALISKDWPGNLTVGDKISKPNGPWMFDAAATVFWQYRDQYNPVWYDETNKKFMIDVPPMLDGLKFGVDARKRGQDAKMSQWTPEWENTFKATTVATYPMGDWLPILLQAYGGDATKGDWGMVTCPGDTGASSGGSLFCAFDQSKAKDEAAKVLNFFTFDLEAQMRMINYYNFPSLIKAWDDPRMQQPVEWYGGQQTRLVSAAGAKKFSDRKYTPYDDQCNTIMGTELTNAIDQGKDPQQALTDAQKTAETQIVIKS
jgi:ABC-type glycerol-3-phosphate transport system substrate-binding protein